LPLQLLFEVMAGGGATEQVGRSTAVAGPVTVQESATGAEKLIGLVIPVPTDEMLVFDQI
jgi:hypothetical protein